MTYRINPTELEGCRRLVFDGADWERVSHDIGDNSCFWKPARITRVYHRGEWLADVVFEHNGSLSRGHFIDGMREP